MLREGRPADAHRDRQRVRAFDDERAVGQAHAHGLHRDLERREVGRRDDEELVGSVPPEGRSLGQFDAEQVGDLEDRLVAGRVAVGLVQQPEVVDVEERDPHGLRVGAGRLDGPREGFDEAAVVERAGERVAPPGFDEQRGPPADPRLGRTEDEEQEDRRERRGAQRDDDDLASHLVELAEDRRRVAPDADDGDHVVAHFEREVLAQDVAA